VNTDRVPAAARELIGASIDLGLGLDAVCPALIRYWCEAFEDANPIYRDAALAGASKFGALVAPSPLAASVSRRPWWPISDGNPFGAIGEVGERLGCPESVVQAVEYSCVRPLRLGDRVRCVETIEGISVPKVTQLGTGHFVPLRREYVNERGDILSSARLTFFKFARGSARKDTESMSAPVAARLSSEGADPGVSQACTWSAAQVGSSLPSLTIPMTVTRMVMMAYVSRDFNPVHHDMEHAQANGSRHMFMQWACQVGVIFRFITDWAGPDAWISRVAIKLQRPSYAHEDITFAGRVVSATEGDESSVEVEIESMDHGGVTTAGSVSLQRGKAFQEG
jgi:acyl dehydratase